MSSILNLTAGFVGGSSTIIGFDLFTAVGSLAPGTFLGKDGLTYTVYDLSDTDPISDSFQLQTYTPGGAALSLNTSFDFIRFTDKNGVVRTFSALAANSFSPGPGQATWVWTQSLGPMFTIGHVYPVTIGIGASVPLAITSGPLPPALAGFPYQFVLTATGGVPPYRYQVQAIPGPGGNSWIQLDAGGNVLNGVISGTPPVGATNSFTLDVIDSINAVVGMTATLQVVDTTSALSYTDLITSEHNQKLRFMQLVTALTTGMGDVTTAIQRLVPAFSLDTAVGAQLDILGLWIGQSRVIPGILVAGYFGFSELSSGQPDGLQQPFGELTHPGVGGIFFELGGTASATTTLTDPQYRTILRARIARNQSNGTVSALEQALSFIFGAGCKVADNGTLSLAITVTTPITPVDQSLLTGLDILPRPAGVAIGSITFTP